MTSTCVFGSGPNRTRQGRAFGSHSGKRTSSSFPKTSWSSSPNPGNLETVCGSLWHDRLELAVVTHGRNGCTYVTPDSTRHVESFDVDAVDPTGAGDGFMAGLLGSVAADPDCLHDPDRIAIACRFANAVGALTASGWGGDSGVAVTRRSRTIDGRGVNAPAGDTLPRLLVDAFSSASNRARGFPTPGLGTAVKLRCCPRAADRP